MEKGIDTPHSRTFGFCCWCLWYAVEVRWNNCELNIEGPMLSPGFVPISKELNISVNTLSQSTAWLVSASRSRKVVGHGELISGL